MSWSEVTASVPYDNFQNQIIWNNSGILIDNAIVFNKAFFSAGIKYVGDLVDEHGDFLSFNVLCHKFNISSGYFIHYHSIIHSIPNHWKSSLVKVSSPSQQEVILTDLLHCRRITKNAYIKLHNKNTTLDATTFSVCFKWHSLLNIPDMSNIEWSQIFHNCFKSVHDTKICYFQYRYLHFILGTNKLLFKMNKRTDPLCSFCKVAYEDIPHLFLVL